MKGFNHVRHLLLKPHQYSSIYKYFPSIFIFLVFCSTFMFYSNEILSKGELFKTSNVKESYANSNKSTTIVPISPFKNINPLYGFILYKGYRLEKFKFIAIGAGVVRLRKDRFLEGCYLLSHKKGSEPVYGTLTDYYPGEIHGRQYETILLTCHFSETSGADWGGEVHLVIHGTDTVFYSEDERSSPFVAPRSPYKHHLTLCSPPIYGDLDPRLMYEWLEYHIYMGMDYFIMYDAGGLIGKLADLLSVYVEKGIMEIHDVRASSQYDIWFFMQTMLLNDCAHKTRHTSKWSMVMDFDEFWSAEKTKTNLTSFLHGYRWYNFISFGTRDWSIHHCTEKKKKNQNGKGVIEGEEEGEWQIERMIYHRPQFFCKDITKFKPDLCLHFYGHRKYAFNPRRALVCKIHHLLKPSYNGLELSANEARFNHFRGIAITNLPKCNTTVQDRHRPSKPGEQPQTKSKEKQKQNLKQKQNQSQSQSQKQQRRLLLEQKYQNESDWEFSNTLSEMVKSIRLQKRFVSLEESKL